MDRGDEDVEGLEAVQPVEAAVQERQRDPTNPSAKNFSWGAFRFTLRVTRDGVAPGMPSSSTGPPQRQASYSWQVECPFHRASRQTGCKRAQVIHETGPGRFDQDSFATILQLKTWAVEALKFRKQSEHKAYHPLCILPPDVLEARIITERPSVLPVPDDELASEADHPQTGGQASSSSIGRPQGGRRRDGDHGGGVATAVTAPKAKTSARAGAAVSQGQCRPSASATQTESVAASQTAVDDENLSLLELGRRRVAETKAKAKAVSKAKSKPKAKSQAQVKAKANGKPKSQPQPKAQPKAAPASGCDSSSSSSSS